MIKVMKTADYFTIGNFACGLVSIFFALQGEIGISALLILAAVAFDFIDGRIARCLKQQNEFGKQLDSLSDVVSFGVAPAVFGYAQGLTSWYAVIILVAFASCGMLRLARFNISNSKGFIGVPITVNGVLFPVIYGIFGIFNQYILILYLVMGYLMVSSIRVKKW